jgi:hypothetical protein
MRGPGGFVEVVILITHPLTTPRYGRRVGKRRSPVACSGAFKGRRGPVICDADLGLVQQHKSGASVQMQFGLEEMLIPLVEKSEFELARAAIEGFEPWATYADYLCEREGRKFGLASAGQGARFAPVSVRAFLDWSAMSAARPTLALLDRFVSIAVATAPQATEAPALPAVHRPTGVTVDLESYREWLECLGEQPSEALFESYAALVVEARAEHFTEGLAVARGRGLVRRWLRSRLSGRSPRARRLRSRSA